ncbi:trafficking protein particle complex subunit 12-like [Dendronephthya gigantea]|uniref:trafficking protein particle complex subunit 12-like n=1 Tax=Dendronephthya gigantea TaxID=151771 RepID=UPI00106CF27D|nr:trafficking protein particle complex subunit 12-like [Dendronephthya gigantea]
MGHGNSKAYTEAIKKLSSLELNNIVGVFNELSTENQDGIRAIPEPNMATRRVFAERFSLPGLIGERLFHAFDRDNNGTINLEEFVGGVALCLHGSAQAKCELLFKVFNFSDDEDAVTEDELKTILLSSLQSANTILDSVGDSTSKETNSSEKPLIETVTEIVQDAFKTCDKSKNGKLSAKEFSSWLHKNPHIMDNVFGWQCPKPELGTWANEGEQKGSKSLQDLFGGQVGQNLSGESFFDSLGSAAGNVGESKGGRKSESTSPVSVSPIHQSKSSSVSSETETAVHHESGSISDQTHFVPPSPVKSKPRLSEVKEEEPFVESYDQYSALWVPTTEANSFLEAIKNSTLKPENAKPPEASVPHIQFDTPQIDPVNELISKYIGDQNEKAPLRSVLTEDMVTCDTAGLKQLLRAECWRSALNLTTKLLGNNAGHDTADQHSSNNFEIWFCRIALMVQLKMHTAADIELEAFGNLDAAVLYYEFYPDLYPDRQGTMVPFCFRLLAAMLPQHVDRPKEALDKLFYVHSICLQVLRNLTAELGADKENLEALQKGIKLWKERLIKVLYCIGNTFLSVKEYGLAIAVFKQISKRDPENTRALMSGIGRISLQSGDIESAQQYFKLVEEMESQDDSTQSDVLINRGLLALTLDAYEEAYKHFSAARKIDSENAVAVNNAAVSLLFQGRLKEALSLVEDIVFANPEKNLHSGILFNICTMYELETSRHIEKKKVLLELISQHCGDGFNVSCLKFP